MTSLRLKSILTVRAFSTDETETETETETEIDINGEKVLNKPPICTADELHYVSVKNSDWRLALWRYHPSPQVFVLFFLCLFVDESTGSV